MSIYGLELGELSVLATMPASRQLPPQPKRRQWLASLLSLPAIGFIWFGAVLAISIEAKVKFQAESLSLPVALDVGQHVFAALNQLECLLAFLCLLSIALHPSGLISKLALTLVLSCLMLQSLWLLPELSMQAQATINGQWQLPTMHHQLFIALVGIKLLALLAMAYSALSPSDELF
ncbi:MAG: hypothetical protein HRU20_04505 [Pseudomonadales bacterium]|nr:hypothetical protein [Pseudomonadales bacterium]